MKHLIAIITAVLVGSALVAPALAAPGGELGTMPKGSYACERPGDATGALGVRVLDEDFTVENGSAYTTARGRGVYLLTGDRLVMTSGPFQGATYRRKSGGFLRRLAADSSETDLRCVLGVSNNFR
ncbi:hypothetical protein [Novosphingobium sp.]|uniref:hypothetical protein n=1 Tax=Novosphingobium sp. TaxID=1874826 RepID=UPI00286E5829|nr:hypothetical protein [Novosphingobium sp.]